jgi:CspA family cold shock protein
MRPIENRPAQLFGANSAFGQMRQPVDNGGQDVLVHISAVERAGLSNLVEGQKINFEIEQDRKTGKVLRRKSKQSRLTKDGHITVQIRSVGQRVTLRTSPISWWLTASRCARSAKAKGCSSERRELTQLVGAQLATLPSPTAFLCRCALKERPDYAHLDRQDRDPRMPLLGQQHCDEFHDLHGSPPSRDAAKINGSSTGLVPCSPVMSTKPSTRPAALAGLNRPRAASEGEQELRHATLQEIREKS